MREQLRSLAAADRAIRAWEYVSQETKSSRLAENAETRTAVEARIRELDGGAVTSSRGIHGLA